MKILINILILIAFTACNKKKSNAKETYSHIVYQTYVDTYNDAKNLQKTIEKFLANPSKKTLQKAKNSWLISRDSYGQTEVFRFYEGPIDDAKGLETYLNSWPVNEAYIDYVRGKPQSGLINNPKIKLTKEVLIGKNQQNDEADVSIGYHAVEFLLWGQDFSLTTAGKRSYKDYLPNQANNNRRRQYLKLTVQLIVEHLNELVLAWKPNKNNYRKKFVALDEKIFAQKVLSAIATLSAFEIASERMATALETDDQEDEHSCFSDNTHNDFIANQQGIINVYLGKYKNFQAIGLNSLIKDKKINKTIQTQLLKTLELMKTLPKPIDNILASPKASQSRQAFKTVIASLYKQTNLLIKATQKSNIKINILGE